MHNLTPENIDSLFKEGIEGGQFQFREDAWDLMEEKLDRRRRWVIALYLTGAATLVALLGALWWTNNTSEATLPTTEPREIGATSAPVAGDNLEQATSRSDEVVRATAPAVPTPPSTSNAVVPPMENNPEPRAQKVVSIFRNDNEMRTTPLPVVVSPSEPEISEPNITVERAPALNAIAQRNTLVKVSSNQIGHSCPDVPPLDQLDKLPKDFGTFGASVSVGYESTGAGNAFQYMKRGYTVGAELEYLFAKRFAIQAGVQYTRRQYTARGEQYTAPMDNFWVDGIAPQMVDGDLTIWEVPVQFRFHPKGNKLSGFFAGAGMSTYLVGKEWYDFTYENPNDDSRMGWGQSGVCRHFFGIANFTAGYQFRQSERTLLRVAPYYNLPITGIGAGAMSMHTAGVRVELVGLFR